MPMKIFLPDEISKCLELQKPKKVAEATGLSFPTAQAAIKGRLHNPTIQTAIALTKFIIDNKLD